MFFIPYAQWMDLTRSRVASRSASLKELDSAIAMAEMMSDDDETVMRWFGDGGIGTMTDAARAALLLEKGRRAYAVAMIRTAFAAWARDQTSRGQEWRASVRNERGAVTTLYDQINYWTRTYPDESTQAALAFIVAERNKSIPVLFKGCEVVVHSDIMTKKDDAMAKYKVIKIAKNAHGLATAPAHSGGGAGMGARFMQTISAETDKLVTEAFGTTVTALVWDPLENLIKATLEHALQEIKDEIAALAPGVGLGVASATLVFNTVKLVMASIAADAILDLSKRLEDGDSKAALVRVRDWQLRAIAARTSKLARAGVNVGLHSAAIASCGVGIPVQLAVGIANAIVGLAEVIAELGMQYKEKRALTAYLNRPDLNRDIFAQAPLAAAYYLLNTPDSHIALQLVQIGAPAWQEDVEFLKKEGVLKTVLSESQSLISAARYRITRSDGSRYRERLDVSLLTKLKAKVA